MNTIAESNIANLFIKHLPRNIAVLEMLGMVTGKIYVGDPPFSGRKKSTAVRKK
jgi:hypothetical protein